MLSFNHNGLLVPGNNIPSDILELEKVFVTNIHTTKRRELFDNYLLYSKSLKELCNGIKIVQWIDGSFVTQKSAPADINVVSFIDFSVIDVINDSLIDYKHPACQIIFGVDAYIVKIYPSDHKIYPLFLADRAYWMSHFNRTRRNRIGNKLQKGFLEINM